MIYTSGTNKEEKYIKVNIDIKFDIFTLRENGVEFTANIKNETIGLSIRNKMKSGRSSNAIMHGMSVKVDISKDIRDVELFLINNNGNIRVEHDRNLHDKKIKKIVDKYRKVLDPILIDNYHNLKTIWDADADTSAGRKEISTALDEILEDPHFNKNSVLNSLS